MKIVFNCITLRRPTKVSIRYTDNVWIALMSSARRSRLFFLIWCIHKYCPKCQIILNYTLERKLTPQRSPAWFDYLHISICWRINKIIFITNCQLIESICCQTRIRPPTISHDGCSFSKWSLIIHNKLLESLMLLGLISTRNSFVTWSILPISHDPSTILPRLYFLSPNFILSTSTTEPCPPILPLFK